MYFVLSHREARSVLPGRLTVNFQEEEDEEEEEEEEEEDEEEDIPDSKPAAATT